MIGPRRSRRFTAPASVVALVLAWAPVARGQAVHRPLPVYFEDNHAGTFQFLASVLDLDQPHLLVLIDAHSDASPPRRLDELRAGIRQVASSDERTSRILAWRRRGDLQAFDWVAALTPLPFSRVAWVRLGRADPGGEAPEAEVPLPPGFEHVGLEQLPGRLQAGVPQVVSIDLDSFSGLGAAEQARRFEEVWSAALRLPRLAAISFAISRPWLQDDEEASRLVTTALQAALALGDADIRFEAFGVEGPDRSERAKASYRQHREPPRFDPETASGELRSLILANQGRLRAELDPARWRALLARWRLEGSEWRVAPAGVQADSDQVFRTGPGDAPELLVTGGSPGAVRRVTWLRWTPGAAAYNVMPEVPLGKTFASAAPPAIAYRSTVLAVTDGPALDPAVWTRALPGPDQTGVLRVSADVETVSGVAHTAVIELRRASGEGFRAGLSEQFGLPYVFGAGFLRRGSLRGPDTAVGNDCANFLIAAWRRSGLRLPWGNPAQLRQHLQLVSAGSSARAGVAIPEDAESRGLVVHLGTHVAALWEDRPPTGILDPGDLVIHHLGGTPEVITLGRLLEARDRTTFDLYLGPARRPVAWLAVGGDVAPDQAGDLPGGAAAALRTADLAVVNLESTLGDAGEPAGKRYTFRAAAERLASLREAGVKAVSLANNHAGDFGPEGLRATVHALDALGLGHFGAGGDAAAAARPWVGLAKGREVAFLAVSLVDEDLLPAGPAAPGIAVASRHRQALAEALREARARAGTVVVIPHWGDEGTATVTDEQRRWARWFVDHGADAVVGSGPHVIQAMETVAGVPVIYSVGNLWFRGNWPGSASQAGVALIGIDVRGHVVAARLVRVTPDGPGS